MEVNLPEVVLLLKLLEETVRENTKKLVPM